MYYSNQFKPRNKEESGGLLKKLPRQLAVVLALMLSLILLRYTNSKAGQSINDNVKSYFYKDMTEEAKGVFGQLKGTVQGIIDSNNENNGQKAQEGESKPAIVLSCNPVSGAINITSHYGERVSPIDNQQETHTGIDIEAALNTPVMAVLEGPVVEWENDENYGLTILIDHGNGCRTRYAHLSKIADGALEPGEVVEKGQIIAYTGESGKVTGPHLHFEILIDGKAVDPEQYLVSVSDV